MANQPDKPRARRRRTPAPDPDDPLSDLGSFILEPDRPDLFAKLWNEDLDDRLSDWHRRRAVLVAGGKPEPQDVMPELQRLHAQHRRERPPPEGQSETEMVRWHYWRDVVDVLQKLARLTRLGAPLALGRYPLERTLPEAAGRETLADLLEVVADLLRDQLQGNAQPKAKRRRKGAPLSVGRAPRAPREAEAAALALAAAELQKREGIFDRVEDAQEVAAVLFGIKSGALRKSCPPALREQALTWVGERMRRYVEPEARAGWLEAKVREAAQQYKEAEITP